MNTNSRVSTSKSTSKVHVFKEFFSQPGRSLTPEIRNDTISPFSKTLEQAGQVIKVRKYLIQVSAEADTPSSICRAFNTETHEEKLVKIFPAKSYRSILAPYFITGYHPNIADICELIVTPEKCYAFFDKTFENLHLFIRKKHKLKENEACFLFKQIVEAVKHCHDSNVIIRDIKLRKFVFTDENQKNLVLTGLEEGLALQDENDDTLFDKHGCLAYISPEILHSSNGYSGKASDVWSLGVVLFTMLVGQYPFHDNDIPNLFKKIRSGAFVLPDYLSPKVKCLLRNILRIDPSARLTVNEILDHPWFSVPHQNLEVSPRSSSGKSKIHDQTVPDNPHSLREEEQVMSEEFLEKFF